MIGIVFLAAVATTVTDSEAGTFGVSDLLATLALLVAVASAFVTWRVHQDSGGRVKVKMLAAYYRPYAGMGSFHKNTSGKMFIEEVRDPHIELCQVLIENPGRTGATVTGVRLRVDRGTADEYTVTPRTLLLKDFHDDSSMLETFFRLEPYDQRSIIFDYWSIVDATFEQFPDQRDIKLYAEVTVAGHEKKFDSKKKGHWRIQRDHISSTGSGQIRRPRNAFLTFMLRSHTRDLSLMNYLDRLAVKVEEGVKVPASADEWQVAIDEALHSDEGRLARVHWKGETDNNGFFASGVVGYEMAQQSDLYGERFRPFSADESAKEASDRGRLWSA